MDSGSGSSAGGGGQHAEDGTAVRGGRAVAGWARGRNSRAGRGARSAGVLTRARYALVPVTAFLLSFATATSAASQESATTERLRQGPVTFVFEPRSRGLAEALSAVPDLLTLPVLPLDALEGDPPVTVYLAASEAAFDSLTGGRAPEWGAGVAFPAEGRIVLPAFASRRGAVHELNRVLRHELAHVALQKYLGPLQVPRWFTEGYSTWAAGQLDLEAGWLLRLAFLTGRAPPLDSLTLDWPASATDARIAYLLSASAVEYLHEHGGDRVMRLFLEEWRANGLFERALFDTYGLGLAQLERYWSRQVRRRYGWLTFAAQSAVLWALTAVVVLGMFMIRRRRDRERMARLRAAELPDDPEFWVHLDPDARGDVSRDPEPDRSDPTGG